MIGQLFGVVHGTLWRRAEQQDSVLGEDKCSAVPPGFHECSPGDLSTAPAWEAGGEVVHGGETAWGPGHKSSAVGRFGWRLGD